jgi:hypothetical protein
VRAPRRWHQQDPERSPGVVHTRRPDQADSPTPSISTVARASVDGPVMRYPRPSDDGVGMAAVRGELQLEGSVSTSSSKRWASDIPSSGPPELDGLLRASQCFRVRLDVPHTA